MTNHLQRRDVLTLLLSLCTGSAHAQKYPAAPIRLIVPFAPGMVTDNSSRIIAEGMAQELGQPVVVDNKPGAQGILGTRQVAASASDGYTLLVATNGTHAANSSLFRNLPYDPIKDFTPIGLIGTAAWALVVRHSDPARSAAELLARLRAPGGNWHAPYFSAASQVCISLLNALAGTSVQAIPYKANGQALTDLLGGQVEFGFIDIGTALAQQSAGKLRMLALTSGARSPLAPGIPALAESLPGYEIVSWTGIVAPRGISPEVASILNAALQRVLGRPDVHRRFATLAFEPVPGSEQTFRQKIQADHTRWARLVKQAGIEPE